MNRTLRRIMTSTGTAVLGLSLMAMAGHMAMASVTRPKVSEFGTGPRRSYGGRYVASIESDRPLAVGPIQTIRLVLTDTTGAAIEGATIRVDGGMPAHHHGLPTKPRVTQSLGGGRYQVEGLKFSMRGWWKLQFDVDGSAGRDSVYFALDL